MALVVQSFKISPCFSLNLDYKLQPRTSIQCIASRGDSANLLSDSVGVNGVSPVGEKGRSGRASIDVGNGYLRSGVREEKKMEKNKDGAQEKLEVYWDDGYGTQTVKDYLELAKEIIKPDGGPPRWFAPVSCGPHLKDSPALFFLPGADGTGLGLTLHHKALGKVFELWCLHIPVRDRTPFEGLIKLVEQTVRMKHASSPNKPIYLLGDSFGGCLALAVAARNPKIDLVVILANPATSFGRSQLQPLFPFLEALPGELQFTIPYLLSSVMGEPTKMAMVGIDTELPPTVVLEQLSSNLTALLPLLSGLADIIPKETLMWKLKLLKHGSAYANSRLHAVTAEVLVLASGKDGMLPSENEGARLARTLRNCKVRYFKNNGHTILLEDHVNLLSIIKRSGKYRRSKKHDFVLDFLPPSGSECKKAIDNNKNYRNFTGPVMFSTMEDGRIVRGIAGVPDEGPVLLVGYHMLMGLELVPLIEEFLRVKKVLVRGIAHPTLFSQLVEGDGGANEDAFMDLIRLFGGLPVSPSNLFKLLQTKSHVLLYPGGAREALHLKGEEYKLIWPDQPEFVRMAARFGATIVPFGVVGEDDIAQLVLDYDDLMKIPVLNDRIRNNNEKAKEMGFAVRADKTGEIANQTLYLPGLLPKIPGRLYYLFGKPISTKGKREMLKDREKARELYLRIKSEVENSMAYLLKKREEDPYRSLADRTAYRAFSAPFDQVPTFDID
nr:acyltransferase-like protein At1g54570, chloroplastic [Ipomoea batatas]